MYLFQIFVLYHHSRSKLYDLKRKQSTYLQTTIDIQVVMEILNIGLRVAIGISSALGSNNFLRKYKLKYLYPRDLNDLSKRKIALSQKMFLENMTY